MTPPRDLTPPPQRLHSGQGTLESATGFASNLSADVSDGRLIRRLELLEERTGITIHRGPTTNAPPLEISLDSSTPAHGYHLSVRPSGIGLRGRDAQALFHGLGTLEQWLAGRRGADTIPCVEIEDWPDFEVRGVMIDISRNKVPTTRTLLDLIELLSQWKINQVQLYTEHTFAYAGHEEVWKDASPLTASDVRELDSFCRQRFVELVPNQNSFGHMHRWLAHSRYRSLAECPDGIDHPFSIEREPFSLCPTDPGSLALLEDLYDQLLPNFSSRLFNVGLDETFDLGLGRSKEICEARGRQEVYLDFLRDVHRLVEQRGHRMLFWADIILQRPDLVAELPSGAIPLLWGYGADHPFEEQTRALAESGLDYYVCPGTSSWNSFAGRVDNAIANLASAAIHGRRGGALGYLIADWGDNGHLQPLPISYPGFLAGACFAWNATAAEDPEALELASRLDRRIFDPLALGSILVGLGNLSQMAGKDFQNSSPFFYLLLFANETLAARNLADLEPESLRTALEAAESQAGELAALRPTTASGELAVRELAWTASALHLALRLGLARLEALPETDLGALPGAQRKRFRSDLKSLLAELTNVWLARNRSGGLSLSAARLERIGALL